jgi:hypothetical protein
MGMGYCQGRYCGQVIYDILNHFIDGQYTREMFTPRLPARPVCFGTIAAKGLNPGNKSF